MSSTFGSSSGRIERRAQTDLRLEPDAGKIDLEAAAVQPRLIDRLARPVAGDNARPALLSPELAADLHETRSFRHRATHSYGDFNASRLGPVLESAFRLPISLPEAMARFRRSVDPD